LHVILNDKIYLMKQKLLKGFTALLLLLLFQATEAFTQNQKICVISDIHYFDPDLLINDGTAFQTYLAYDRKLLQESEAILESVIDSLIAENPNYVFVAGDLTKDGELTGHQKVASYFQQLEDAGIEVIITPGNHDINNPHAVSFDGDDITPVSSVSPTEFASIYDNFGFAQAVSRDTNSLSFAYELTDSITVISMDVCRYDSNYVEGHPTTSGGFKPEVLEWILSQIETTRETGRTVMGIMHHGIVEHYTGQKDLFSEYVIDNWDSVSTVLANAGMNIVFTGHYHAQDMVMKTTDESFILDIETGSTVTYPCPFRIINITDNLFSVSGKRVQEINYDIGDVTFQEYALDFIETGLPVLVKGMLMGEPYNLPDSTATILEPAITESFIAHYEGDEGEPSPQTEAIINMLLSDPNYSFIGYALLSIWNDPQPGDWTVEINLADGTHVGLNKNLVNRNISLYPNPTRGTIHLDGNFTNNNIVKIYNLSGQMVYSTTLHDGVNTLSTNLNSGLYTIEISGNNIKMRNKLIVK
jgi:hypothetical protein